MRSTKGILEVICKLINAEFKFIDNKNLRYIKSYPLTTKMKNMIKE